MLWVLKRTVNEKILLSTQNLKRTVSMRWFFWAPKTYVQTDGLENIYNFTLKNSVYLNLCLDHQPHLIAMPAHFTYVRPLDKSV